MHHSSMSYCWNLTKFSESAVPETALVQALVFAPHLSYFGRGQRGRPIQVVQTLAVTSSLGPL